MKLTPGFQIILILISLKKIILFFQAAGNCCWEIFEKEKGRGKKKNLKRGEEWYPNFELKKIRKTDCYEEQSSDKKSALVYFSGPWENITTLWQDFKFYFFKLQITT